MHRIVYHPIPSILHDACFCCHYRTTFKFHIFHTMLTVHTQFYLFLSFCTVTCYVCLYLTSTFFQRDPYCYSIPILSLVIVAVIVLLLFGYSGLKKTATWKSAPIRSLSYMFRDKKCVGDSRMTPRCKINKMHVELHFYRMRELISTKILNWMFIDGKNNSDDVQTKYWAHHELWPTYKPILFWPGDNVEHLNNNSLISEDG